YYLCEYAYSFMLHGDGEPLLFYYEDLESRFCYVVMKNDIAESEQFCGELEKGAFYDMETPYGYGGPLCDSCITGNSRNAFRKELFEYCAGNNIITQFIRFHPLLENDGLLPELIETRYLRDTIFMDTMSKELIWSNMDSKNRNMVRKAQKNGVSIIRKDICEYQDFLPIYEETMRKNHAEEYYYFQEPYFESLEMMADNACYFYAEREGRVIGGSIMLYNDNFMHYHLSGTYTDFKKYSPGNLLLHEAACWACERGIHKFHLGGGMRQDDSLFGFKKQFNKIGRVSFVVGRTVFDEDGYGRLMALRKSMDSSFDEDNKFMIQYRF
ncbi:MAG: GNAT family N-acetyltransferase, partial [Bacteroides sp.]|nr:GNAT family N-acetyltransferase [Bacteroides sp.]